MAIVALLFFYSCFAPWFQLSGLARQNPPTSSSFSHCVAAPKCQKENRRDAHRYTTRTLSRLAFTPQRIPHGYLATFFSTFFFPLLVINSVSLSPVSPGAPWHLCSTSTCSLWAFWIKPAWKSCISHITESCSGGFARQRRTLKINVALQGDPVEGSMKTSAIPLICTCL